jgi:lysylphosphatidylglycerol synthetase-like protein (DUF2156 family)
MYAGEMDPTLGLFSDEVSFRLKSCVNSQSIKLAVLIQFGVLFAMHAVIANFFFWNHEFTSICSIGSYAISSIPIRLRENP